ncbi:MAG: hypothetical protein Q8O88_01540 [bacterium]|nr:hypothetical protein [bacterium]
METKKTFIAVANILKKKREVITVEGNEAFSPNQISEALLNGLCREFADHFSKQNPKFDRERFLKACGIVEATQ